MRFFALYGISISAYCGGTGKCGKCKIKLLSGKVEGGETNEKGVYLACRSKPLTDCKVLVGIVSGNGLEVSAFRRRASAGGNGVGAAVDLGTT
ncbi:MAG: 2Fe-2S iron-sulfur cluster binding domain-containing protein, partial [Clostridia bacterium]|nr:2Fe-2S iron-sulfur cluster binding domain-containing protein [Clostridia bacterium]